MNGTDMTSMSTKDLAAELLDLLSRLHAYGDVTERQRLVTLACAHLATRIEWSGSATAYCTHLVTVLVVDGQATLINYLICLTGPAGLMLGPDDRNAIASLQARIAVLSRDQWRQAFPPYCFQQILNSKLTPPAQANEVNLDALREADDRCGTGTPYPKLDHDRLLVECDLKRPCDEFANRLGETPAAGIYSFATAGDQELVERFVLPRLRSYLSQRLGRKSIAPHFYWAVPGVDEVVDLRPDRSKRGAPVPHWREQFESFADDPGVDQLVVVWNARLSADAMAIFANSLHQKFFPALLDKIQGGNKLFFVFWADIEHESVVEAPCYWCLPLPDRLTFDEVRQHFDYHLKLEVQDQDRECAMSILDDYLEKTGGKTKSAFLKMQDIVDALKSGRI